MIIITNQLYLSVPPPISVVVMSNRDNPIRPVGSNVTLTCSVELSPIVDIEVNVIIVWTGPNNTIIKKNTHTLMGNITTTLESNVIVRVSGRDESGDYTCSVNITALNDLQDMYLNDSGAMASNKTRITTGMYLDTYSMCIMHQSCP